MEVPNRVFGQLAEAILKNNARKATKFISNRLVVKASRRLVGGKIDKRDRLVQIHFTLGPANYQERQFIKNAKQAGEPLPVRKVLLKFPKP
jgi:hypothetical protein